MVINAILSAFFNLFTPDMLVMLFLGTFLGLAFGALPGLSAVTGMALVLPFTFGMDSFQAMLIYAGIISVSPLGGSLPAILLNTPGTPQNAVTCFEGFPLTRKGESVRAISISSTCCLLGTVFGVLILFILLPLVLKIIMAFRAPEIFWLTIISLVVISVAVREDILKGLAAGGIGILISLIGWNDIFAGTRFTGGSVYLWDGIPLIPFSIGLLALTELIDYTSRGGTIAPRIADSTKKRFEQILQGIWDVLKRPYLVARSAAIGTGMGIVPGVGGAVASFVAYAMAKRTSKNPESFGKGNVEGLIAAEVSNDSKEGGSLLPTVAFGIPGSPDMAVVLGAFILHGLEPGPLLLRDHLDVVVTLALGLTFCQIIGSVIVVFVAGYIARLVTIQSRFLAPAILIFCLGGAYSIRQNIWDVFMAVASGIFGYFLKRFGFPVIPLLIGYILGNMTEKAFHQSLMMSYGSYKVFFSSPISIILIVFIVFLILSPYFRRKKE